MEERQTLETSHLQQWTMKLCVNPSKSIHQPVLVDCLLNSTFNECQQYGTFTLLVKTLLRSAATFKQSPIDASFYCAQLDQMYTESSRKIQLQSIKNGYIWSRIIPNRPLPRRFRESLKNSKRLIFSHIQHTPQTLCQATTVFSHHFDDLNDDKRRRKTKNGISAGSGNLLVDGLTPQDQMAFNFLLNDFLL